MPRQAREREDTTDSQNMASGSTSDKVEKFVPVWVAERLGLAVEDVATLHIPNEGAASMIHGPYHRYLKYLAKVAWDIGASRDVDLQAAKDAAEKKAKRKEKQEVTKDGGNEMLEVEDKDKMKCEMDNVEKEIKASGSDSKKIDSSTTTCDATMVNVGENGPINTKICDSNGKKQAYDEELEANVKANGTNRNDEKDRELRTSGSEKVLTNGKEDDSEEDDNGKKDVNSGLTNLIVTRFKSKNYESRYMYSGFFGSVEELTMSMPERNVRAEYGIGLGCAVLSVNGKDLVYCIHRETGSATISLKMYSHTPRAVHLYAKDTNILQAVTKEMIEITTPPLAKKPKSGKYILYSLEVDCSGEGRWAKQGLKQARSLNSVVLPDGMMDSIVEDFKDFTSKETKAWYVSHGLPYRRSYLFHGPPGVGKTSSVRALAGTFQIPACFISLGNMQIGNKQLHDAMKNVPKPSILVFEDIDSLFNEKRQAESTIQLTFSGLLNALDGLVAAEGVVTVMTTNHFERLDPALVRAGRVDRRFEFTTPHHEQIKKLFSSYYPDADIGLQTEFANAVFGRPEKEARSIATLQQHFIYTRKKSARESIELLEEFFAQFYPKASSNNMTYYT